MKIAIIGWGSLIWDPRSLAKRGGWRKDGPALPLEFARVSTDGRLTLVLHAQATAQQTYWVHSALDTIDRARDDLRAREGRPRLETIRWTSRDAEPSVDPFEVRVLAWLLERASLDAAIWTGLPATLSGDVVAQAVAYLLGLEHDSDTGRRAGEYIEKTPPQIQTAVRREMQSRGWKDAELSAELFEP